MAASTRCKVEAKKIAAAVQKAAAGGSGSMSPREQCFLPPAGVVLTPAEDDPTRWRVQIDCNTALEAVGLTTDLRAPLHWGGGDDGVVWPPSGSAACPVVCKDAFADAILDAELKVGDQYPKYKFGDQGKDISLAIEFVSGWDDLTKKAGFAHKNISQAGKVSIGGEMDGMYCTQSPFVSMCGGDGKWDAGKMNVAEISRHLVILMANPFMIHCGDGE
eukprot:TRINITY_DN60778_c0_g1_i1.p2 TRINITY_DN60778_c0_g1~~TRINITY_DN60778_c0_g1_i1.p2  ORF type:complete len:250 (+),score=83.27 TRINITY_DN60778_c0_g1_i1:97-750(+)